MKADEKLFGRVLDGCSEDGELDAVRNALREDPEFRKLCRDSLQIHCQLGVVLESDENRHRRLNALMLSLREAARNDFVWSVRLKIERNRFRRRMVAAAAVAVICAAGWFMSAGYRAEISAVAVAGTSHFSGGGEVFPEGHQFQKGDEILIPGGLMRIRLKGKGSMILEGPARLRFEGGMRSSLLSGKVFASIEDKGKGYEISTKAGSVVDLGTEFGVSVSSTGEVETHVFKGKVSASKSSGQSVVAYGNQALLLGSERIWHIPFMGEVFTTRMPQETGAVRWVRWSFDEGEGTVAKADTSGLGTQGVDMAMKSGGNGDLPVWTEGVFGKAVSFPGEFGHMESGFEGIGGGQARTIAMWLKMPAGSSVESGMGALAWGEVNGGPNSLVQCSVNGMRADGPEGRLRIGFKEDEVIGETDVRDGKWHHVAFVISPGPSESMTEVLIYLDGKPERTNTRYVSVIDTKPARGGGGLLLGQNLISSSSTFKGELDEVFIGDVALESAQIRELMETNKVPTEGRGSWKVTP